MACRKLFTVVILVALCILKTALAQNIDCHKKGFTCLNSKQFLICVDMGGGNTQTVDNVVQECLGTTTCSNSAQTECENPPVTTLAPTNRPTTRKTTIKPAVTTPKPQEPGCPRLGAFGDPNDCHVFYKCFGSLKIKFTCPLNTAFSNNIFLCTPNLDSCPPFKCVTNGVFEDPKSCFWYYTCTKSGTSFITNHISCPLFMSFNPATKSCRFGILDCIF